MSGAAAVSLDSLSLSAAGAADISGTLAVTLGTLTLSANDTEPVTISGLLVMTFSAVQPGMTFSATQPDMTFSAVQPGMTFSVED